MTIFDDPNWLQDAGMQPQAPGFMQGGGPIAQSPGNLSEIIAQATGIQAPQARSKRTIGNVIHDVFEDHVDSRGIPISEKLAGLASAFRNTARLWRGEDPYDSAAPLRDMRLQQEARNRTDQGRNAFADLLTNPTPEAEGILAHAAPEALMQYRKQQEGQTANRQDQIGQALSGVIGSENPAEMWGQIAQSTDLDPAIAGKVQEALVQGIPPEALAARFGYKAPREGSAPKEMQIYGMLQDQDPELANAYLKRIANPAAELTPYQVQQIGIAQDRLDLERDKFENPAPSASERAAVTKADAAQETKMQAAGQANAFLDQLESAFQRLDAAGGMNKPGMTGEQRAGQIAVENIPFAERVAFPDRYSAREDIDGLLTQGVLTILPAISGATIGSKNFDAAKEMENLKKSIASARDFPAAQRAIARLRERIVQNSKAAPVARPAARGGAAPQRQVRTPPAVGQTYQRPDGSTWRRTGPGRYDWEKVG